MQLTRTLTMLGLGLALAPLPAGTARASGGGGEGGLHLVPLEKVTVPIVDSDRMSGTLNFKIVVDAGSAETQEKLNGAAPEVRAAVVAAGLEFARLDASGLRAVDAEQLDHDLTAAIKLIEPGIARVLIVEVSASQQ